MDRDTELALLDAALASVGERRCAAEGEVTRVPVGDYLSPARLEAERALFRQLPLVVGFASQVREPGDFITHSASGVPVLVLRGRDGVLRAFVNACRHRGTLLVSETAGHDLERVTCPYHAWTYDATGALRGLPHQRAFGALDVEQHGLVPLAVRERFGAVFVVPTPHAAADVDAFLEPFAADLDGFGLDSHQLFAPSIRTHTLNWKLMIDGSYESYHFKHVHASSIYPMFFDTTGVFAWREPHARMVLPKRSVRELEGTPRDGWHLRPHANVIYGLFPNALFLVQPDHVMVVVSWPEAVDRTTFAAGMLVPGGPLSDKATAHFRLNESIFWNAIEEDIDMAERIQRTLASGANESLTLGRFEFLAARFHEALDRRLPGPGPA